MRFLTLVVNTASSNFVDLSARNTCACRNFQNTTNEATRMNVPISEGERERKNLHFVVQTVSTSMRQRQNERERDEEKATHTKTSIAFIVSSNVYVSLPAE